MSTSKRFYCTCDKGFWILLWSIYCIISHVLGKLKQNTWWLEKGKICGRFCFSRKKTLLSIFNNIIFRLCKWRVKCPQMDCVEASYVYFVKVIVFHVSFPNNFCQIRLQNTLQKKLGNQNLISLKSTFFLTKRQNLIEINQILSNNVRQFSAYFNNFLPL